MSEHLKVELPIEFRDLLKQKFDFRNMECRDRNGLTSGIYDVICPLCNFYKTCRNCPFHKFSLNKETGGCLDWIKQVIGDDTHFIISSGCIEWSSNSTDVVKREIVTLAERSVDLIKWRITKQKGEK